jgi:hypothetical protein
LPLLLTQLADLDSADAHAQEKQMRLRRMRAFGYRADEPLAAAVVLKFRLHSANAGAKLKRSVVLRSAFCLQLSKRQKANNRISRRHWLKQ